MRISSSLPGASSLNIDHLGIVAGIIDDIGLVEQINRIVGTHKLERISSGQLVKAMILNGLGFVSAPLYLFSEFFTGKATEHLIGQGVTPEVLNDDKLARVLDELFENDLTRVFVSVAAKACQVYSVKQRSIHLDASSFSVHGEYHSTEEAAIEITYGYSRDKRPDLKQFIVDLMLTGDGDIPVFFRVADGNENDKEVFARLIREYQQQLNTDALFVADSALYSFDNLQVLRDLKWLCRVPLTLNEAKDALEMIPQSAFEQINQSHRAAEMRSEYAGVPQRWLIIESEARKQREQAGFEKRLGKLEREVSKDLKKLSGTTFHCEEDAISAALVFASKLRYHHLMGVRVVERKRYAKRGQPSASTPFTLSYFVEADLVRAEGSIEKMLARCGRYILATNDLTGLTVEELLAEYKAQQGPERGFKFLKDPLFFTSSVFIKTPARVAALAMVMGLSLLVYSLGQRLLRQALGEILCFCVLVKAW